MTDNDRKLIAMVSPEGKTDEELAEEVWQAYQAHQQAQEEGTDFEPHLDLRPESQE